MFIGEEKMNISFPTDERRGGGAIREEKIKLESLKDLYSYENKLVEVLKRYTNQLTRIRGFMNKEEKEDLFEDYKERYDRQYDEMNHYE